MGESLGVESVIEVGFFGFSYGCVERKLEDSSVESKRFVSGYRV